MRSSPLRSYDWQNSIALFERCARTREARVPVGGLGSAYGHQRHRRAEESSLRRSRPSDTPRPGTSSAIAFGAAVDAAADAYREAVEHTPRLVQAWYNLALVEQMRGRPDAAVDAFAAVAQISPKDPQAQTSLGDALLAAGRPSEAVASYSRAIDAAGNAATGARLNRGVALERSQGCEAALPDYLAAAETPSMHATAIRNAIGCLRALGREQEARQLMLLEGNREIANPAPGR
jgi:tetratricopeptide (TPR) repeat protein